MGGELEVGWKGIGDSGEGPFPSSSAWKKVGILKWVGRTGGQHGGGDAEAWQRLR